MEHACVKFSSHHGGEVTGGAWYWYPGTLYQVPGPSFSGVVLVPGVPGTWYQPAQF